MTTPDGPRRATDAAAAGAIPMAELGSEERRTANAKIDAHIREAVRTTDVGAILRARGVTIVTLDEEGNVVEDASERNAGGGPRSKSEA